MNNQAFRIKKVSTNNWGIYGYLGTLVEDGFCSKQAAWDWVKSHYTVEV